MGRVQTNAPWKGRLLNLHHGDMMTVQEQSKSTLGNPQATPLPPEAPVLLDVDGALKRLAGKQWIYFRILEQFVSDCSNFAETLDRCLAKEDRKGAERLAHKMKGAAGQAGASALFVMAPELQQIVATQPTDVATRKLAEFGTIIQQTVAVINDFLVSQGLQTDPGPKPLTEPQKIPQAALLESIREHASMGRFSQVERIIDDLESKDRDYIAFCEGIRKHIRKYDETAIAAYINRWT